MNTEPIICSGNELEGVLSGIRKQGGFIASLETKVGKHNAQYRINYFERGDMPDEGSSSKDKRQASENHSGKVATVRGLLPQDAERARNAMTRKESGVCAEPAALNPFPAPLLAKHTSQDQIAQESNTESGQKPLNAKPVTLAAGNSFPHQVETTENFGQMHNAGIAPVARPGLAPAGENPAMPNPFPASPSCACRVGGASSDIADRSGDAGLNLDSAPSQETPLVMTDVLQPSSPVSGKDGQGAKRRSYNAASMAVGRAGRNPDIEWPDVIGVGDGPVVRDDLSIETRMAELQYKLQARLLESSRQFKRRTPREARMPYVDA